MRANDGVSPPIPGPCTMHVGLVLRPILRSCQRPFRVCLDKSSHGCLAVAARQQAERCADIGLEPCPMWRCQLRP